MNLPLVLRYTTLLTIWLIFAIASLKADEPPAPPVEADNTNIELIVRSTTITLVDDDGKTVSTQYRGDTLDADRLDKDRYHIINPDSWVSADKVIDLEQGVQKSTKRVRGRRKTLSDLADRALVELGRNNTDEALEIINDLLDTEYDDEAGLVTSGLINLEVGNTEKALEDLQFANTVYPENVQTILLLVRCHLESDEHQEILELLDYTSVNVNDNADLLIAKSYSEWMLDENEAALQDANRAIELGTNRADAWYQAGGAQYSLGEYDEALALLTDCLQKEDDFTNGYYYRGLCNVELGQLDNAIEDFTSVIELSPEDVDAFRERGRLYRSQNKYELAIQDMTALLEISEDPTEQAEALLIRGLVHEDQGDVEAALKDLTSSIEADDTYAASWRERGRMRYELSPKEAYEDVATAINLDDEDPLAWRFMGDINRIEGTAGPANDAYTKALELNPQDSVCYNNRGITFEMLNNDNKALEDYYQAIAINPFNLTFHKNIVAVLMRNRNYEEADRILTEAQKRFSDSDDVTRGDLEFRRGEVARFSGNYEDAITHYRAAIKLDPEHAGAHNCRGICYDSLGNYDRAIDDYTKAFQLDDDSSVVLVNRGDSYVKKGDNESAHQDYTRAMELAPDSSLPYNQRGLLYYNLGDYETAIVEFESALERDPNSLNSLGNLADSLRHAGYYQKAIGRYSRYLTKAPLNLAMLYGRAECYRLLSRPEESEAGFRTILSQDNTYSLAWVGLGELYEAKDQLSSSIQFYDEAIKHSPDYIYALYRRGFCLSLLAKHKEAIEDFSRALDLDNGHINARLFRANSYRDIGEFDLAMKDYDTTLELPTNLFYPFWERGRCLQDMGRYSEALNDMLAAREIDSTVPGIWNEPARIRATAVDSNVFDPKQAIKEATEACRLTERSNPFFLETLAMALAADNQFQEAAKTQKEAISLANDTNAFSESYQEVAQNQLDSYLAGKTTASSSAKPQEKMDGPPPLPPSSGSTSKSTGGLGGGAGSIFGKPRKSKPKAPPKASNRDQAL